MKTNILFRSALFLVALSFFFCEAAAAEIRIGVTASLSGNWAALGQEIVRGVSLAAEEENAELPIGGEKIVLQIEDSDEAESSRSLLSAYRALRQNGISLIIGPTGTPGALSLLPVIEREDVLLIAPSVGIAKGICSNSGRLLNIQGPWESASRMIVRELRKNSAGRVAILASDLPYEKAQADAAENEIIQDGGKLALRLDVSSVQNDLRSELQRLIKESPDAIFLSVYNQLGLAAKQLRTLGYGGVVATIQVDGSRLESADGALEGILFSGLSRSSGDFQTRYRNRFGKNPDYPADYAYDALKILVHSIKALGSKEPQAISKFIHESTFPGASGALHFDPCGHAERIPQLYRLLQSRPVPLAPM